LHPETNAIEMDQSMRLIDITVKELINILDNRYGQTPSLDVSAKASVAPGEFLNIHQCAQLTGYSPAYIRQLTFKKAIPYHKNPKLKPIRFKRAELLEWMATKKFTPINDQADAYISKNSVSGNRKIK
jgi:predicted DNA-binding transcriptional regulator AlpA